MTPWCNVSLSPLCNIFDPRSLFYPYIPPSFSFSFLTLLRSSSSSLYLTLPLCQYITLSICISIHLSIYPFIHLSVCLSPFTFLLFYSLSLYPKSKSFSLYPNMECFFLPSGSRHRSSPSWDALWCSEKSPRQTGGVWLA